MTSTTNDARIPDVIDMSDAYAGDPAFALHQGGKLVIASRVPIDGPEDLSLAYTPGVGRVEPTSPMSEVTGYRPLAHRWWQLGWCDA